MSMPPLLDRVKPSTENLLRHALFKHIVLEPSIHYERNLGKALTFRTSKGSFPSQSTT